MPVTFDKRQGDVGFLTKEDGQKVDISKLVLVRPNTIIRRGEGSDHVHQIEGPPGSFKLFSKPGSRMVDFVQVIKANVVKLVHRNESTGEKADHNTVALAEEGLYPIRHQRQQDFMTGTVTLDGD